MATSADRTSPRPIPEAISLTPFARILVGSIPTEQGDDALALALELAEICGAEVQLVGVTDRAEPSALEQATERLSVAAGGRPLERRVEVSSSPARGLTDAAVRANADLIVVGSSHRGPVGRVLLGSVGERLLERSRCAVAVAPRGHALRAPQSLGSVIVAYDGSPEAALALRAAHALTRRAGLTLELLTVVVPGTPGVAVGGFDVAMAPTNAGRLDRLPRADALARQQSAAWTMLEAAAAELDEAGTARTVLTGADAAAVLLEIVRERPPSLLMLGSRSHGPLRRVLLGSVSTRLLRGAAAPVLVTPRGGEARSPA